MTEVVLDRRSKASKDSAYQKYLEGLTIEERKALEQQVAIEWNPTYEFEETWDIWEKSLDYERINKFLIVHFPIKSSASSSLDYVYFVNIIETANLIQRHYQLFQKYVGFDFDPLSVTLEIKSNDSPFWNKIFNGASSQEKICLLGLLFGYGIENSYPFSWYFSNKRSEIETRFISTLFKSVFLENEPLNTHHLSSQDFPLPGFKTFSSPNTTLEKYKQERKKIQGFYKNKNLESITLEKLYN